MAKEVQDAYQIGDEIANSILTSQLFSTVSSSTLRRRDIAPIVGRRLVGGTDTVRTE